jgi:hypothetical protein
MPKRSNIFQRLVKLLHERLDSNWVVTESEMLTHRLTNEEREVDIVLRYRLGPYTLLFSVECTDTNRPASSTWVEAMAKKHEFLPTSKLVLWSASGFYKPAMETAQKLGIDIVAQDNNDDVEWSKFTKIFNNGFVKLIHPEYSYFIDVIDIDGEKIRLEGPCNYTFRVLKKEEYFTILQLKEFISHQKKLGSVLLDHVTETKKDFWVQFIPPFECLVQKEDGNWVKPFRIGFGIKIDTEKTELKSKSASYEGSISTLATGEIKSGIFELFVQEKQNEPPKISAWIKKDG